MFISGVIDTVKKYPNSLKCIAGVNDTAEKLFVGVHLLPSFGLRPAQGLFIQYFVQKIGDCCSSTLYVPQI
jgi:hypothetical protein